MLGQELMGTVLAGAIAWARRIGEETMRFETVVGEPWARGEIVKKDLSKVLMPDHPLYKGAAEALKLYHHAQPDGFVGGAGVD